MDYSNHLVYGHSSIPRIVQAHPIWGEEKARIRYYIREEDDSVLHEDVEWFPYAWIADKQIIAGLEGVEVVDLKGDLHYQWLVYCDNYDTYKAIKSRINMANDERKDSGFYVSNTVHAWLIQSGNTMFKGMTFNDPVRMQLDIETYGENHFPDADDPNDPITIIALSDNRGRRKILHWKKGFDVEHGQICYDERNMLMDMVETIRMWDPDIIELHNGFNYDWPYINTRCEMHDVPLAIGRDVSIPYGYTSMFRAAEREVEYTTLIVNGRNIIDTMFAAMSWDAIFRELPSHGLKPVAQHFKISSEDRVYVPGDRIWWHWDHDPEPLLKYALDDVLETGGIAERLLQAQFYATSIFAMPYEDVARRGTGGKIEGPIPPTLPETSALDSETDEGRPESRRSHSYSCVRCGRPHCTRRR